MGEIKISIIMPVHNTGIYLEECLLSIVQQKFSDFELICVDDCSTDVQTREILKIYQEKYANITVLFLEQNVGAGEARNIGFSKAQGEYIIFLDADDVFEESMLSEMYEKAVSEEADVCVCDYKSFFVENGEKKYRHAWSHKEAILAERNREDWFLHIVRAPWNKLCKTSLLKKNKIYFQSLPSCNDLFFSCMVMNKAERISCVSKPFIQYRCNTDFQISANRKPCNFFQAIALLEERMGQDEQSKIQLFILCLVAGRDELLACKNETEYHRGYELLYNRCLLHKEMQLSELKAKYIRRNVLRHPKDDAWLKRCTNQDFDFQLFVEEDAVKSVFDTEDRVYIWGRGKRGLALQQLCCRNYLSVAGITDQKNENIGMKTELGYCVVHSDDVLNSQSVIIATNAIIYENLLEKYSLPDKVVNLEAYCPM